MDERKGRGRKSQQETPVVNSVSEETQPMATDATAANVEETGTPAEPQGTEPQETTAPADERPIVDILVLGANVPSPLVKRFTDAQREEIRRLFYGPTPEVPESWGAGHEEPDIIRVKRAVTITKDTSKTPQDESWSYWGYIGVTEAGRAALSNGKSGIAGKRVITKDEPYGTWQFEWIAPDGTDRKPKTAEELAEKNELEAWGVGDFHDYGFDLDIRQPIRAMLSDAIKGDVQKLASQVRAMVKIKAAKTHLIAFKMLVMQREAEGETLPEHITYKALGITEVEEAATGVKR
jgi:hypothetical protein